MNAPVKIEHTVITADGQLMIPPAIRDAAGLLPGMAVQVMLDENGQVVVNPHEFTPEEQAERRRRFTEAVASIGDKYRTGRSTDEYMREIRGDWAP